MAEFASPQETQLALTLLLDLQENPETLEGFFNKYPDSNPFTSWPFRKEPTEAFLRFFEKTSPSGEAEQGVQQNINPRLEEMIEEFDREYADAKERRVTAQTASKKFVSALKENAKKSAVTLPETPAAAHEEMQGAPVAPERVQHVIIAALQHQGPPEEKLLVFHALTAFSAQRPEANIADLLPRAVAVSGAAKVLSAREEIFPAGASFSEFASNGVQKNVALVLDRIIPPAAKEAVINKILLRPLDAIVNHPENLPKNIIGEMTDRWGENFVNSSWFTQLRADANRMIGDQKGTLKVTTRLASFASDVATTVLRGPRMEHIITYIETYRLVATQGIRMTSVSHYHNISMGYGGQLLRMGADYAMRAGIRAGVKKAAVSVAAKVGVEVIGGAATGGTLTLAMMAGDILKGIVRKGAAVLKSLLFMGDSKNPEDNLLLIVGAGVVLVFFLPIFPLLNIPAFNQSMIDTSIANSTGGGPENANQYLDITITVSPESVPGALPVTLAYKACVKPKGHPSSFTINSAGITFSVYGGTGSPGLNAISIPPGMFLDGCYSFTVLIGTQFKDSVVTATFSVNADVGLVTSVDGSASVSTVIGNPPTGCFVFGGAGVPDAFGHVSTTWDNKAGILAAIGELARSPQYMAQVCAGGAPVTLYRVNASYSGGSTSAPASIFIYNACVTGCATYTLAHETGHVVDIKTGLFGQYNGLALYAREGPLWTYPNAFSEHEDFAETLGAYVVWHSYVWGARHGHPAGKLDYTGQYPLHYQFAKSVFGIEY